MPVRASRPSPFTALTALLVAAAVTAFALAPAAALGDAAGEPRFWALAALAIGMELLPISLVRGAATEVVTVSSAFALVVALEYGALPAMTLWVAATVIADVPRRLGTQKLLFNAAQYAVSVAAAALVLEATGATAPIGLDPASTAQALAAGIALFGVNHLLAGAGLAVVGRSPLRPLLLADGAFFAATAAFQLALVPLMLAVEGGLVLLAAVPVLAGYAAGRRAVRASGGRPGVTA